jgi:hypothetical protein
LPPWPDMLLVPRSITRLIALVSVAATLAAVLTTTACRRLDAAAGATAVAQAAAAEHVLAEDAGDAQGTGRTAGTPGGSTVACVSGLLATTQPGGVASPTGHVEGPTAPPTFISAAVAPPPPGPPRVS